MNTDDNAKETQMSLLTSLVSDSRTDMSAHVMYFNASKIFKSFVAA